MTDQYETLKRTILSDENAIVANRDCAAYWHVHDMLTRRELTYRFEPLAESDLDGLLRVETDVGMSGEQRGAILRVLHELNEMEPQLFMSCKGIAFIKTYADLERLCRSVQPGLKPDGSSLPEAFWKVIAGNRVVLDLNRDMPCLAWYEESIAIINTGALQATSPDAGSLEASFWQSLLHVLRQVQAEACVYDVPWLEKQEKTKGGIAGWSAAAYDHLFAKK